MAIRSSRRHAIFHMVFIKFDLVKIQVRRDFVTPTTVQYWIASRIEDYGLKESNDKITERGSTPVN